MNILKHYEKVLECMTTMSNDICELAKIIAEQQKQIATLTSCIEQLQDVVLFELEKGSE